MIDPACAVLFVGDRVLQGTSWRRHLAESAGAGHPGRPRPDRALALHGLG